MDSYQFNATRLVRYMTARWKNAKSAALNLRIYGSDERYRQTFRAFEFAEFSGTTLAGIARRVPTKFYLWRTTAGSGDALERAGGAGLLLVAGADAHDVRVGPEQVSAGRRADESADLSRFRAYAERCEVRARGQ